MRKKLTVLVLVGLALVLLAGPALAAGTSRTTYAAKQGTKQGVKRTPHVISLTGTILVVDKDEEEIYVAIQMTNRAFITKRGDQEWVATNSRTVYVDWSQSTGKKAPRVAFSSLAVGQKVSINALAYKSSVDGQVQYTFTARRIEIAKPRYP